MKPSPFPGMDPFLESHWGEVHHSLIQYSRDALQAGLPDDLLARVEERVFVESDDVRIRGFVPDSNIVESHPGESAGGGVTVAGGVAVANGIAVAEPQYFLCEEDETVESYIEIREGDGGRVVTVIEFLSPSNKAGGEGTESYLRKQRQLLASKSSLVEIDLVRAGRRVLAFPRFHLPQECQGKYLACIRRRWQPGVRELYSFSLRQRLPALAIPLRSHEPPLPLDLQAIVDQAYRNGRYDRLNYRAEPQPPLPEEDARWADELLKAGGWR